MKNESTQSQQPHSPRRGVLQKRCIPPCTCSSCLHAHVRHDAGARLSSRFGPSTCRPCPSLPVHAVQPRPAASRLPSVRPSPAASRLPSVNLRSEAPGIGHTCSRTSSLGEDNSCTKIGTAPASMTTLVCSDVPDATLVSAHAASNCKGAGHGPMHS
eukprot:356110-Chlamydomonas_euryale.AAC.3